MKQCPQCRTMFSDDNQFCQNDGTVLTNTFSGASQSYSGETPTVLAPGFQNLPDYEPTPVADSNKWIFPVFGLLLGLIAVLSFLAFSLWRANDREIKTETASVKENNNSKENQETDKKPQSMPLINVTQTPITIQTPKKAVAASPTMPEFYGQSRIRFAKGAISATVSGEIDANGKRTYVLATRNNQYLSAAVNSQNGCIVFDNHSVNTSFTTTKADQYLYLENNCSATNFSLTVFVR